MAKHGVNIIGYLDAVVDHHAIGWAYAPSHPKRKISVEIVSDNTLIGRGVADQHREDLEPAGIGTGHHMFRIPLSTELLDGKEHSIRALTSPEQTELQGSPHVVRTFKKTPSIEIINRQTGLKHFGEFLDAALSAGSTQKNSYLKVYEIGAVAQETNQIVDAAAVWDALDKRIPNIPIIKCKRAEIHLLRREYIQGANLYENALLSGLCAKEVHAGLSLCFRGMGDIDRAIAEARLALSITHEQEDASLITEYIDNELLPAFSRRLAQGTVTLGQNSYLMRDFIRNPGNAEVYEALVRATGSCPTAPESIEHKLSGGIAIANTLARLIDAKNTGN